MTQTDAAVHILMVDDRPENLLALEAMLSPLGHTLVRASSGREALRALLEHDFAMILLDVQMPGIDGYETAELIRGRARSSNTPIVFLTAVNTGEHHVFRGYEVGAVDYLLKPIEPTILLSKVSVFIALYQTNRTVRQQASQLERSVAELEQEIARRQGVEAALRQAQNELEERVQERTAELRSVNQALRREIGVREQAEQDLTAALRREQLTRAEAEAAVQVRDHFLAVASHELKTPLTAIAGHVQLLKRRLGDDAQLSARDRNSIEVAVKQTGRLSRMVEMLLDISRIQAGLLAISRAPLDFAQTIRRTVREIELTLEHHRIELYLADEPLLIEGDELRLEQVLYNLVNNAIKYSLDGGTVTVRAARNAGLIVASVADQGIGIPSEALPHIFERFYRAPNADDSRISGMGIGLYVVQQVVALHGGYVEVASTEDSGSTFTIALPARPLHEPTPSTHTTVQHMP